MEKVYTSPLKNYLLTRGYIPVSNLLFDFQQELDITESELLFIIRIMKNKNLYAIHDSELDSTVSSKTLSRRRNDLKRKGLLNFSIIKKQDLDGTFITEGISYDLSPLEEKLQEISNAIDNEKERKITKVLKENKFVIETEEDIEPLDCFKQDFKNFFGKDYNLSEYEEKEYNNLNKEEQKAIAYIFKYCYDNKLFDEITPRLSLFFKTKFRFDDLKKYVDEKFPIEDNLTENDNSSLILKTYYKYYKDINDNLIFFKSVERLINRFAKNNVLSVDITKLLDKAYIDTYSYKKGDDNGK